MTQVTTFKTGTRITIKFGSSASTRKFYSYLVSHKIALVILCDTFFCGFSVIKFHKSIAYFQFNVNYLADFAKAILQIFLASMLGKATNVYLVRLDLLFASV